MRESLDMMAKGVINPTAMITHVGGLDAVIDATLHLGEIPGGKKLIYTHISLPLTAIEDFGKQDTPFFRGLAELANKTGGFWSAEAEKFLLENAPPIGLI